MDRTPADRPDQPQASNRFNEDKASYTLRAADAADLETGVVAIRDLRPVYSSSAIHARAAVEWMLEGREAVRAAA